VTWLLDTNTIIYAQYVGGRVRERLDEASSRGRIVTSNHHGSAAETRDRVRKTVGAESAGERFVTKVLGSELGL
jgi:hypothetical protein